ncbi:MAG: 3-oxoacyl-ACP reductase [Rhodospirillales bacterium]|nr:3-oxoacyl-ACP reductase [Rhodospirillales bacterium]
MDLELAGKVAIVTGGGRGIGRAIVAALAAEGATVAIVDRDNVDRAEALAAELGQAAAFRADVSRSDDVAAMVEAVTQRFGKVDILVNNAGTLSRKSIIEDSYEDWDRVLRTNLYGCYHCARAVAPAMIARGTGRIVNISSIHGRVAKAAMGSYCTSKAAIDMFTKQLAVELAPHGVTVNAVAPGTISTEINLPLYKSTAPADVALQQATLKKVPMGRIGEPEDIGRAVAFLASGKTPYITGAILYVDGGYIAEGTPRL